MSTWLCITGPNCGLVACVSLGRDEPRGGLRRLREQRERKAAPVADRAGGLREISRSGVGKRREEHLQDTVETRRETGLQPGWGCRAFQGKRHASFCSIYLLKVITFRIKVGTKWQKSIFSNILKSHKDPKRVFIFFKECFSGYARWITQS